jgi:hypothetical protein
MNEEMDLRRITIKYYILKSISKLDPILRLNNKLFEQIDRQMNNIDGSKNPTVT